MSGGQGFVLDGDTASQPAARDEHPRFGRDEVRRDMPLYHLHHGRFDFTRISELLGFADALPTAIRARG